jgi:hypothetical protein
VRAESSAALIATRERARPLSSVPSRMSVCRLFAVVARFVAKKLMWGLSTPFTPPP